MYSWPQYELVYTVDNTSDSETQWLTESGDLRAEVTLPNSLIALRAEGLEHRVTPSKRGERTIIKFAYTTTDLKLPAFDGNLAREAFAKI